MINKTYTKNLQFSVGAGVTPENAALIASRMREEDVEEFACWGVDPWQAVATANQLDLAWTAYRDSEPVFVVGLKQFVPGGYYLSGFGSENFDTRTLAALTRWGMGEWLPSLFYVHNIRRIEAIVPARSTHSIAWLTKLGMRFEARMTDYIKRGDEFFRLSFTVSNYEYDIDHVHV